MNEIPLGIHDLLQEGPHPAAGVDHGLPVEVGEHLHDLVDEGLLIIMSGPVSVPLSYIQITVHLLPNYDLAGEPTDLKLKSEGNVFDRELKSGLQSNQNCSHEYNLYTLMKTENSLAHNC